MHSESVARCGDIPHKRREKRVGLAHIEGEEGREGQKREQRLIWERVNRCELLLTVICGNM